MNERCIYGYEDAAEELIGKFESVSSTELFTPVREFLPQQPSHILDIGAGTGRDAAWLAEHGHECLAVEPVTEFRKAGMALHKSDRISWLDDTLPDLPSTCSLGRPYDLLILPAVWKHLDDVSRKAAFIAFRKLLANDGKIIMSLRHGDGAPSRPVFPANVQETIRHAEGHRFRKLHQVEASSAQEGNRRNKVSWTWLVLQRNNDTEP